MAKSRGSSEGPAWGRELHLARKAVTERGRVLQALDMLADKLTEHGHTWTAAEKASYEAAARILLRQGATMLE